ncbi:MAG TPA: penicillin-binding protein 2, partial [Candidatus Sulfotelmatobacter sp.]|nr:penicillin-binding protein 2 [Candidatus Sulfotelmatobacter sp.]
KGWFLGDVSDFRKRGRWLLTGCVVAALILAVRLTDVQLRQGPQLAAMAAAQRQGLVVLPATRGKILDHLGRVLVSNRPVYAVFADPGLIPDEERERIAAALSPVLSLGPGRVEQLLQTPSTRFVYIAHGVSEEVKNRLTDLELPGIGTLPEEQRVYEPSPLPNSTFAANLLGFVDHDGHGQYGVEGYYDELLRGADGVESTVRDLAGNSIVVSRERRKDPRNGSDLHLGMDSRIQYWAEQALAKGVAYAEAESGQLLVMDTATGAIRAWADFPTYDANHYPTAKLANFRDLSVGGLYEPGSTMKVITFAGGLDQQAITPNYAFNEGPVTIDGFTIEDFDRKPHGIVTMRQVLEKSLNDGAIKVMQLMGEGNFYRTMVNFGVGARTGVDLSGESARALPPPSKLARSEYATASFGQGIVTTPVALLAAINAVGNGGVWVQPHAVEEVTDPNTGTTKPVVPSSRRVMSAEAAATLKDMMTGVVDDKDGSGFLARIPAFKNEIAGKTGTASEPTNGHYSGDIVASFVGFMPASHPEFTMLIVLRSPHENKVDREGAYLAAPVWKDVAQIIVDQWRITP